MGSSPFLWLTHNCHTLSDIWITFISSYKQPHKPNPKLGTSNVNQSHNSSINSTLHWFACVGGGEDNQVTRQEIPENNFDKFDFDNVVGGDEGTLCVSLQKMHEFVCVVCAKTYEKKKLIKDSHLMCRKTALIILIMDIAWRN